MLLSVVIIGRNEGERLAECLRSVRGMHREGFEVETIYVDSGSVDGSVELAEAMGARVVALAPERPSAALGRNAGWRTARGEIILFLDGDTILHPGFVAASLPEFAVPEIAVVWGHRRETHPERSPYVRFLDLDWIYAPGFTPYCGGDALMRRDVLESVGGFDDTLIAGEEPELCRRIAAKGYRILHVDRPMTGHDLAITHFRQYWRRNTRAGYAYSEVSAMLRARGESFWEEEAVRNRNRALAHCAVALLGVVASLVLLSAWPFVAMLLFFAAISLRSAWKNRWKTNDRVALLLYGVHSHFQQLPIFWGQLKFKANRRRGTRAALVEYKRP
jgi:cellulose synthase/poly-beta-1,6-N-acetylglucosamine synthase-like glycosyltransferase